MNSVNIVYSKTGTNKEKYHSVVQKIKLLLNRFGYTQTTDSALSPTIYTFGVTQEVFTKVQDLLREISSEITIQNDNTTLHS